MHLCFIKDLSSGELCLSMLNKLPKSKKRFREYLLKKGYEYVVIHTNKEWFDMGNHYTPSEKQVDIKYLDYLEIERSEGLRK